MEAGMLDRANDLIGRASKLDDAVTNMQAFRGLLEELDRRCPIPYSPHLDAIRMVRAASLRSAIGLATAILDRKRTDRASLGQVVELLEDPALGDFIMEKRGPCGMSKLAELCDQYAKVVASDTFTRVSRLRHGEIGHLLIRDEDAPATEHSDIFELVDEAERLVILLHEGLAMLKPNFVNARCKTDANAKLFWDTYLAGIA
jgi:hypothetical protein